MATIGTVLIDVKADTSKLVSGMDRAEKSVNKAVGSMKTAILSVVTAYAGIQGIKAFDSMIKESLDAADATGKLSQQLGLTTEAMSNYQYAAGFAAVSNGELNAGLSALIRRLNNFERTGGGAAKKAFEELGISAEYARTHLTSTDTAFKEILKRLEKMPDGFKKTAIAQDIFSKSASGIMKITATDLQKFSSEAEKIGITIPQSVYNMAAAYHDEMDQLDARMKGFKQTISFSLVAPLNAASKTAVDMVDEMFGSDTKSKITSFENVAVTSIGNVVYSIGFITDAFTGVELVINGIKQTFYYLGLSISQFFDDAIIKKMNSMLDTYNSIADTLGLDKISGTFESSTPNIINQITDLRVEAKKLIETISSGRETSNEFMQNFIKNLSKIKEEAKKTSKETANIVPKITSYTPTKKDLKKEDAQYIKDLQEFYKIDIDKGLNDQNSKVDKTFEDWGKTLNSSISNSIVDAIQSGDVAGALKGLGSSISSSMLQSSTANLVNSATQPSPSETAVSSGATGAAFGGVWGLLAGAGIGYITGVLTSDGPKSSDQLKQEYFAKIDKQTNSIVTALEKQTKILGQFGDDFSALMKTYDASRETFLGSEKKLNSSTQFIYKYPNGHKITTDPLNKYMGVDNNALSKAKYILTKDISDFKKEIFDIVGDTEKHGAKAKAEKIYSNFYAQLPEFKASVNDYISSMLDVKDSYTNLSDSLKSVYDNLNDGYYEAQKLKDAQKEVNSIVGNNTLSDYLKNTITGLDSFGTSISALKNDLTSEDFLTQLDALQKLEAITGKSFDNNTAEALNYLDSIQLVGDAMATSNANIKSWEDSFKTEREIAQDMASKLHVTLATSLSGLSDLFQQLSTDADGLTDSDLKLLNANKKLLSDNNKALDTAYLGQYSPLTMLQKADYANNVAYNASGSDIQTQIQASYQALQAIAQTATTDEQIRPAFDRYAKLLEQQTADSTRKDIVEEIMKSNEKLTDVIDRLERLEQAS